MSTRTLDRFGALGGIVYFVSVFVGIGLASTEDIGASKAAIAQFFEATDPTRFVIGSYIQVIGLLALLVFVARFWGTLRRAENGEGWLATAGFGGALAFAVIHFGALVALGPGLLRADEGLNPDVAVALMDLSLFMRWLGEAILALFFATAGLIIVRTGVLSRWIGWGGLVIALGLVALVPAAMSGIAHIPATLGGIWIVIVSSVLMKRRDLAETSSITSLVPSS